jgi:hypothetical protein
LTWAPAADGKGIDAGFTSKWNALHFAVTPE